MATIKYRYYDDAPDEEARPYIDAVKATGADLDIDLGTPRKFDSQIELLRELTDGSYDGVILDLRLDQVSNEVEGGEKEKANYRAPTLAQELRTLGTEREIDELPIVLWSMEKKLRESYEPDETSHDLFDLARSKEALATEEGAQAMAQRLIALSNGYERIRSLKSDGKSKIFHYLGFDDEPKFLDSRILSRFDDRRKAPAHEYARFIIGSLLEKAGPLIAEDMLAARLGVSIADSEDWSNLKDTFLQEAQYDGPFFEGWPRWWASVVESQWRDSDPSMSLNNAKAGERVEHLRKATGLSGLEPTAPIGDGYSRRYWTICLGLQEPLDPLNGLMAKDESLEPWHDRPYLSKKAALEKVGYAKGLRVSPSEKAKLKRLKRSG